MTGRPPRDRDASGRPRNARPRDGLGRPLERGAAGDLRLVLGAGLDRGPGSDADPGPDGTPVPDPAGPLAPADAVRLAQSLLDAGRPFHAHEVLEDAWKAAPGGERELWRGLAQVAVGLTHARRGNARGAIALLRRGATGIRAYQEAAPHGIDAGGASARAIELADRIERSGPGAIPQAELTVRLTQVT